MSHRDNDAWSALQEAWHRQDAHSPDLAALEHMTRRRTRAMWWVTAAEVVLTAAMVAYSAYLLRGGLTSAVGAWLAVFWSLWAIAVVLAWSNRWGVWRPAAKSPRAFLALSLERARRRVRAAHIAVGLLMAEVVLFPLILWAGPASRPGALDWEWTLRGVAYLVLFGAAVLVWAHRYRRRARQEMATLQEQLEAWEKD